VLVTFRTDASVQIGTGHVMRCLALADELARQGHESCFVCRVHPGHLGGLIASKGYNLTLLPLVPLGAELQPGTGTTDIYAQWLGATWQEDVCDTLDAISDQKPDWLVVDHYGLDARWERLVASAVGNIMVIDDLANRAHECKRLLDQNLGRVHSDYDGFLPDDSQRLIGLRYALLRPEFAELRERSLARRRKPELKRILISLGGVDRTNATGQVLTALAGTELPPDIRLDIVMGATAPALQTIQSQAVALQFEATVSVNVSDMAERMCLADLSIGAAGSTSWERCCIGLPAIMIILADNQRMIGDALAEAGAALLMDESLIVRHLGAFVNRFAQSPNELQNYASKSAAICDGHGTDRLVRMMAADN
jgi:UDP-2,4-diacetamido-2,4,6-trideoxy-beta-L-altropyranose hydrolase